MSVADPTPPTIPALAAGDPRRPRVGRSVAATLVSAIAFLAFAWTGKEVRGLYLHAPWQNDPYDVVVSFALFFVPLGVGVLAVRAALCRRDAPLPVARLVAVQRASRLVLAAVLATLAADWLSVGLRADEAAWNATTAGLVAALAATTLAAVPALVLGGRAGSASRGLSPTQGPDAMADALAVARHVAIGLGPLGRPAVALVRALELRVAPVVRRHPLATAAIGSAAFGAAVSLAGALEEDVAPVLGIVFGVATCAMFAFLAAAGSHLGLVRAERSLDGARRRLADAAVLGSAVVPVCLAFRGSLLWLVGATDAAAGPAELAGLVAAVGTLAFLIVLGVETLAGAHAPSQEQA